MTNLSLEEFENGVKIYQDENLYKFTSDAIKLAKFCKIKHSDNVLDLCAGCGVVGFYAYSVNPFNKIYFNDIQSSMCELISKNIMVNNMQDKAIVLCKDLNELSLKDFDKPLDVVLCNPPYFKLNGKLKEDKTKAICRHEITTNLKQIVSKVATLIKTKGKFCLIVPADRLCEVTIYLNEGKFEIKNMEIYTTKSIATVCLLECVKNAQSGVKIKIEKE